MAWSTKYSVSTREIGVRPYSLKNNHKDKSLNILRKDVDAFLGVGSAVMCDSLQIWSAVGCLWEPAEVSWHSWCWWEDRKSGKPCPTPDC